MSGFTRAFTWGDTLHAFLEEAGFRLIPRYCAPGGRRTVLDDTGTTVLADATRDAIWGWMAVETVGLPPDTPQPTPAHDAQLKADLAMRLQGELEAAPRATRERKGGAHGPDPGD